jgi:hypothetical protein
VGDRGLVFLELRAAGRGIAKKAPVYAFGSLMRDIEDPPSAEIDEIHDALRRLLEAVRIERRGEDNGKEWSR